MERLQHLKCTACTEQATLRGLEIPVQGLKHDPNADWLIIKETSRTEIQAWTMELA